MGVRRGSKGSISWIWSFSKNFGQNTDILSQNTNTFGQNTIICSPKKICPTYKNSCGTSCRRACRLTVGHAVLACRTSCRRACRLTVGHAVLTCRTSCYRACRLTVGHAVLACRTSCRRACHICMACLTCCRAVHSFQHNVFHSGMPYCQGRYPFANDPSKYSFPCMHFNNTVHSRSHRSSVTANSSES